MNIIDGLLGEHGVLYAEIDYLEGTIPEEKAVADVQASLAFLAAGVQSHSRLEDELVFVSLERHLDGEQGVIQSMRRMHADLDATFERLRTATDLGVARDLASSAVALAREHFSAEEELCFPLAEDALPQDQLLRLGDTWAARRGLAGA
jgi:hemerythrin-like domain-containing protein